MELIKLKRVAIHHVGEDPILHDEYIPIRKIRRITHDEGNGQIIVYYGSNGSVSCYREYDPTGYQALLEFAEAWVVLPGKSA